MAAIPIWKDKVVSLSSGSSIEFRITKDGSVIYSGKSVKKPGDSYANARVNDICADHLIHSLPTLTDRAWTAMTIPTFVVQILSGSSWTNRESMQFYPDWSYDYGFTGNNLSFPINGRVDRRQCILVSVLEKATPLSASYRTAGGSTTSRSVTISPSPGTGTGAWLANAVSDTERITINGNTYNIVTDCGKYALYYVNAYGGWDQFLLEGNDMEMDEVTRHIREVEYDNTLLVNRGMDNYVNEIDKSFTLNSGLLTDDQASRMHHLLNSPLVYLCEISTGNMIPVIMKTNTCEYKTFSNQGNKMFNYVMQVEIAQNRIRR